MRIKEISTKFWNNKSRGWSKLMAGCGRMVLVDSKSKEFQRDCFFGLDIASRPEVILDLYFKVDTKDARNKLFKSDSLQCWVVTCTLQLHWPWLGDNLQCCTISSTAEMTILTNIVWRSIIKAVIFNHHIWFNINTWWAWGPDGIQSSRPKRYRQTKWELNDWIIEYDIGMNQNTNQCL